MGRAFRPTFSTAFVTSALMAGWGWPECGSGSTNWEAGWICIRTATAPGWSPLCLVWNEKAPPKKLPQIDPVGVGRTLLDSVVGRQSSVFSRQHNVRRVLLTIDD